MAQKFLLALRRLLNATAFENVGHLRDFEELLQRGARRDACDNTAALAHEDRPVQEDDRTDRESFPRIDKGGP